jgi:uncharacterized repeat protein (TIGR02543 family)
MTPVTVAKNVPYQTKTLGFSRYGYTFVGWATSPEGVAVIQNNGTIIPTGNMTLYAVWQRTTNDWANITFNPNATDVTGLMPNQSALKNRYSLLNESTLVRPGHTFAGWATLPGGSVQFLDEASIYVTVDITLYAVWTKDVSQDITITYNKNNGTATGVMAPQETTIGVSTVLTKNAFKLPGHVFLGWTDDVNVNTVKYTDGQILTLTESVELFAVWGRPNDGGSNPLASTATANPGDNVHWTINFWNTAAPNSTTLYDTVIKLQFSSTLVYTGNFKIYKNNVEVDLDYAYDFSTGLLTLLVGDLNPGDAYRVEFDSMVLNVPGIDKYTVTMTGDGSVERPAAKFAPFTNAMRFLTNSARFNYEGSGTIIK